MRVRLLLAAAIVAPLAATSALAAPCTPTGYYRDNINLTAALVNPALATGPVDATGCDIGVYFSAGARGLVQHAEIFGARYFGVVANGDDGEVSVDVLDSAIHDIGESPFNGSQHGVAVYYRAVTWYGSATGRIDNNLVKSYQKGGIVANGEGTQVTITGNVVLGLGRVAFIAQNGIQVGYGATASVMRNTVVGHAYTGSSASSAGILVVGGEWYGGAYTTGTRVMNNLVVNNDVGVYLSNIDADGNAPAVSTNIKVVNNTISNDGVTNGYVYQAGVSDQGNNDKIIANRITGPGYTQTSIPGVHIVDADPSSTNRPKVHANR